MSDLSEKWRDNARLLQARADELDARDEEIRGEIYELACKLPERLKLDSIIQGIIKKLGGAA